MTEGPHKFLCGRLNNIHCDHVCSKMWRDVANTRNRLASRLVPCCDAGAAHTPWSIAINFASKLSQRDARLVSRICTGAIVGCAARETTSAPLVTQLRNSAASHALEEEEEEPSRPMCICWRWR